MLQYAVPKVPPSFSQPPPALIASLAQPHPKSTKDGQTTSTASRTSLFKAEETFDPGKDQPALSALAFLAANAPALADLSSLRGDSARSSTPASAANMSTQSAPAATPGGSAQTGPPVCANCSTSTTPLWRRDESGAVLCNACGLFLKLHGRPRPISLKTDVIKSRNRVKTSQARKRDSSGGQESAAPLNGYPAAHPDVAGLQHGHSHGLPMGMGTGTDHTSHAATNGNAITHPNPPHHIFDTASLSSDTFASPSLPAYAFRQHSPSPSAVNGHPGMDPPQTYEALVNQNNSLRTRVSELEVINDLFRGRVTELETGEREARRMEQEKSDEVNRLNAQLQAANARAVEMESRLASFERESESGPLRKKQKLDQDNSGNNGEREGGGGGGEGEERTKSTSTMAVLHSGDAAVA